MLLGNNWAGSVDFLRILAIWGFLRSTGNPVGSLHGPGRLGGEVEFWSAFRGASAALDRIALWCRGLAWSLLGVSAVLFIPGWRLLVRPLCGAGLVEYSIAALKPIAISVLVIGPVYWISIPIDNAILRLFVAAGMGALAYLATSYKGNREWFQALAELLGTKKVGV